ncbi:sulfotransferase [Myceligenerans crystallogenes]|uniref:Sulfotransferase family protein n=1 Tax=Myceligenerans crystallogenes TaxID=316335 RepID=A0ABN2NBC0_9MICO
MSSQARARDAQQLVFVGGMHRSGTTLVADILASVPGGSGLRGTGVPMDEGQHLQQVYAGARGRMDRWAHRPEAHLTEAHAGPGDAEALWRAWAPYWDPGAWLLVEKSPPNLTKTRYLQALFPQARFIVVTRHPVVQALAIRKWAGRTTGRYGPGLPRLIEHWVHAHETFEADARHVRRLLVLRYEHLVRDPVAELRRVAEFLGTGAIPDDAVSSRRSGSYERAWHATSSGMLNRAVTHLRHAGRRPWQARQAVARELLDPVLLPRYRRHIAEHHGSRIAALGYDLGELDTARPWTGASSGANPVSRP